MSLINVKDLTFRYDGTFSNIFENVSFNIDTDWKLGQSEEMVKERLHF